MSQAQEVQDKNTAIVSETITQGMTLVLHTANVASISDRGHKMDLGLLEP